MRKQFFFIILFAFISAFLNAQDVAPDNKALLNYQEYCANCHGPKFQGGNAQSLVDGVWQFGGERGYLFRNIKFGIPHLGMPSYAASLSDDEINSLVTFLQEEEKKAGAVRPPTPEMIETQDYKITIEVFADSLEVPWAIDFLNENTALITERPGRVRIVKNGQLVDTPLTGTPEVLNQGQGGLLDVAVDPNYAEDGWVYLAYSHELPKKEGDDQQRSLAMTRIVRGQIMGNRWMNQQTVFEAPEETYRTTRHHYGSRIVFGANNMLYFSIGDRGARPHAQDITKPNGKIHRVMKNGDIPQSNPYVSMPNAIKSIFAYGNRNPQGLAIHPETGDLWETEHGPFGGDELNLIKQGKNYGWPEITYGRNYNGTIITEQTAQNGMEQPNLYWKPSIAVCGLDFYHGDLFPKWNNKLMVGALKDEEVKLLHIVGDRVIHEQTIVKNLGRVRDVCTGPDGAVYVVLNNPDKVIRLTPMVE